MAVRLGLLTGKRWRTDGMRWDLQRHGRAGGKRRRGWRQVVMLATSELARVALLTTSG
jgi:hypothetical protein